ncbi:hypothetical protein [Flavobacterium soyangense]|uniref:Uncharacterized protein n=1 Tax=Flavobacterium soyangense TaxID=2023265 RepID=A0A930UFR9_9FLAO|nr:hypothetical protein [Flavobacterium soyangense]MBF2709949.1 hypothetical protein [Flavobacterium soyangense]
MLLTSTFLFGQNCKYKINEVDEFTKNIILETKAELLTISGMGFGFSSSYSFKKINNNRYLKLGITSPSIFTLRQGRDIMFKTNTEDIISLEFPETIVADYISGSRIGTSTTPSMWTGTILIPISNENYERLLKDKILKVRIYTGDGYIDDDVKEKRANKFQELLKCV